MFPRGASSRNLMRVSSDKIQQSQSIFSVTKTRPRTRNKEATVECPKEKEPLAFYYTPVILMDKLSKLIYSVVEEKIKSAPNLVNYNHKKSAILCQILAAEVKKRVKMMEMKGYRIVTMLSIVPKQQQGVSYKMGLHGDHLVDFFGNSKYEAQHMFILGTVYMVHYKH